MARAVTFRNYTNAPFVGRYDSIDYPFAPGQEMDLPEYLARHFAKHLANFVLQTDPSIQNGEVHTSPEKPEEDSIFLEQFNKAYIIEDSVEAETPQELEVKIMNKPKKGKKVEKKEEEFSDLKK